MTDSHEKTEIPATPNQRFELVAPKFTAGSKAWRVSQRPDGAKLRVARGGAVIGNLVWTDLPEALIAGAGYRLTIEWAARTTATAVNLHIRNPETRAFRVIGKAKGTKSSREPREDTVYFEATERGFSQFMLGASHFPGWGSGADIRRIEVEQIPVDEIPAAHRKPKTSGVSAQFASKAKELALKDQERQVRSYAHAHSPEGVTGARARMIFHAHAVEKGLSRSNLRPGFGKVAVPGLAKEMNAWLAAERDVNDVFLQSSAAVMKSYFTRNASLNADVSHYRELFSPASQMLIDNCTHEEGGVLPADRLREVPLDDASDRRFIDVMYGRRSVREYTREAVSDEDIARAVQIAMQAPSVCNRQGVRVHQFEDAGIIKSVLDIQGGFSGYKMPPRLLLVSADLDAFLFAAERNQPFVDGGLFMMSLLLGLTEVGLGSCSLNTAMGTEKENSIREIIDIPDHEVFISFIAVGHYDENVLVPRSKRTDMEHVLVRHRKR